MKQEQIQNIFIGLLAVGLILVGTGVYLVSQQVKSVATSVNGIQRGVAQLQVVKPVTTEPTVAAPVVDLNLPTGDNDAGPAISFGNFAAWIPLDWEAIPDTSFQPVNSPGAKWKIVDAKTRTERVEVSCPTPEAGFEAWDFTKSTRSYDRRGVSLHASKWIGRPIAGSEDLGWLIVIMGGSPDPVVWGGQQNACMMTFNVSNPPTQDELGRIDTIYEMIR
ncbi:MAG: hypothetical protein WCK01_02325 [Candidatus Uhrbacteria bacterium]